LSLRSPISEAQLVHRVAAIFRFTPTPKVSSPPSTNGRMWLSKGSSRSKPDPGRLFHPEKNRLLWGRVPLLESPAAGEELSAEVLVLAGKGKRVPEEQ